MPLEIPLFICLRFLTCSLAAWLRPGCPRTVCAQLAACLPSSLSIHSLHLFSLFSPNCCRISCLFVPFFFPFCSFVALAAMGKPANCCRHKQGEEGWQPGKQGTLCCVWGGFANEVAGIVLGENHSASRLDHRILCDELSLDLMAVEAKGNSRAGGFFSLHVLLGVRKRAVISAERKADALGGTALGSSTALPPIGHSVCKTNCPPLQLCLGNMCALFSGEGQLGEAWPCVCTKPQSLL